MGELSLKKDHGNLTNGRFLRLEARNHMPTIKRDVLIWTDSSDKSAQDSFLVLLGQGSHPKGDRYSFSNKSK